MDKIKVEILHNEKIKMLGTKMNVPRSTKMMMLQSVIRRRIRNLKPEEAIFMFIKNGLTPLTQTVGEVHSSLGLQFDEILFIEIMLEETFGC